MKHIYVFSGLGVDKRVFQFIDFSGFKVIYIDWLIPNKNETIENYATRLTLQINSERPILIGLSFGGMMATEVAKIIDTEKVILLSSAKTKFEIPFYFRLIGFLNLHKLAPTSFLKHPNFLINWFFGIKNKADKKLFSEILKDTNPYFLAWAIDKIATWKNVILPKNFVHIHGTSDRLLPIAFVKTNFQIQGGGHFMIVNKAKELSALIRSIIL